MRKNDLIGSRLFSQTHQQLLKFFFAFGHSDCLVEASTVNSFFMKKTVYNSALPAFTFLRKFFALIVFFFALEQVLSVVLFSRKAVYDNSLN